MKEVFTKSFWEGVKKTFDDALEGPQPADKLNDSPTPHAPQPPSASSESEANTDNA